MGSETHASSWENSGWLVFTLWVYTATEVAQASRQSLKRNTRKAQGGGCETTSI